MRILSAGSTTGRQWCCEPQKRNLEAARRFPLMWPWSVTAVTRRRFVAAILGIGGRFGKFKYEAGGARRLLDIGRVAGPGDEAGLHAGIAPAIGGEGVPGIRD